jgi:hypothetical protein
MKDKIANPSIDKHFHKGSSLVPEVHFVFTIGITISLKELATCEPNVENPSRGRNDGATALVFKNKI